MLAEGEEKVGGRRGEGERGRERERKKEKGEREGGREKRKGGREGGEKRKEEKENEIKGGCCLTCQKHLCLSISFHSLRRAWSLSFLLACTLRAL